MCFIYKFIDIIRIYYYTNINCMYTNYTTLYHMYYSTKSYYYTDAH